MSLGGMYPPFVMDGEGGGGSGTSLLVFEGITVTWTLVSDIMADVADPTIDDCGRLVKHLCTVRGDQPTRRLFLTDPETGDPIDITGLTAKLAVNSDSAPDGTGTQVFEIEGVAAAVPTDGYFDFTPSLDDSLQDPDVYFYDVQIRDSFGKAFTKVRGKWRVDPDITDAGA